jgi:IclR family KDG regulon transcriptional repressor
MHKQKLIPAVDRTLDILELLANKQNELSFTELSSSLNIPKPSLSRLLSNLQQRGYVNRNPVTRKYQLTLKLLTLSDRLLDKLDLREKAKASIQKLMERSKETVELAILDDKEMVYIDKLESYESIRLVARIGSRYSTLHPTAVGKVFLAYMPEEDSECIIREKGLKKFTENTITDVERLREELKEIQTKGYAFDDQEVRLGIRRIAAPIFNHSKKMAGVIGIAGPTFRMRRGRREELAKMVTQAAKEISNELGWRKAENDA